MVAERPPEGRPLGVGGCLPADDRRFRKGVFSVKGRGKIFVFHNRSAAWGRKNFEISKACRAGEVPRTPADFFRQNLEDRKADFQIAPCPEPQGPWFMTRCLAPEDRYAFPPAARAVALVPLDGPPLRAVMDDLVLPLAVAFATVALAYALVALLHDWALRRNLERRNAPPSRPHPSRRRFAPPQEEGHWLRDDRLTSP